MPMLKTLQNIMELDADENYKEESLRKFLQVYSKEPENCHMVFNIGVRWIADGNSNQEVSFGWMIIHILEEDFKEMCNSAINPCLIENLLTNPNYDNRKEIALLCVWCFSKKHGNPEMELALRRSALTLTCLAASCHVDVLLEIVNLFTDWPAAIPREDQDLNGLCECLVVCFATLPVPDSFLPGVIKDFHNKVEEVRRFLDVIYFVKPQLSIQLTIVSLRMLYHVISNSEYYASVLCFMNLNLKKTTASFTLACVLPAMTSHVMEVMAIGLLNSGLQPSNLHGVLSTLCLWMLQTSKWPAVAHWLQQIIIEMERARHFILLTNIALEYIERLFCAMKLPAFRTLVAPVAFYMLAACQTPHVFHKVVPHMRELLYQLQRENSESSRDCIQVTVNMASTLMKRFPNYDELYSPLLKLLDEFPSYPPGSFSMIGNPSWKIETQDLKVLDFLDMKPKWKGLNNLGNTCYMNSVIQALFMTRRFCHAVLGNKFNETQIVLSKLQVLFAFMMYSPRPVLSPEEFYSASRPSYFIPGQQQDSSEFLMYLLDILEEQEAQSVKSVKSSSEKQTDTPEQTPMDIEDTGITRWTTEEDLSDFNILDRRSRSLADFGSSSGDDSQAQQLSDLHSGSTDSGIQSVGGDDSPSPRSVSRNIVRTCFGGRMQTSYQCLDCNSESVHSDLFIDIQLSFPDDKNAEEEHSVQDLLDFYLSPEKLCGDNSYSCAKCGELKVAQRTIKVLEPPAHLILTLKHFNYNPSNNCRIKLSHRVKYPEFIDLPVIDTGEERYRLYAAVLHSGKDLDFGHYHAFARDNSGLWYMFDDSSVTEISLRNLSSWKPCGTPYILFYARVGESFQPEPGKLPPQSIMSLRLQELLARDTLSYIQEKKMEEEKNRKRIYNTATSHTIYRNDDNDDNPPSNCGDSLSFNSDASRYVY